MCQKEIKRQRHRKQLHRLGVAKDQMLAVTVRQKTRDLREQQIRKNEGNLEKNIIEKPRIMDIDPLDDDELRHQGKHVVEHSAHKQGDKQRAEAEAGDPARGAGLGRRSRLRRGLKI